MRWTLLLLALAGCVVEDRRRDDPFENAPSYRIPRGNIRVNIDTYEFSDREDQAFEAALGYRDASVDVGVGGIFRPNGLVLFAARRNFAAAFRAQTSRYSTRRYWNQFIVTAENSEARLDSIQQAPVATLHVIPVYNGAVFVRNIEYKVLGSGFWVRPLSLGPTSAQVEITPWLAYSDGDHPAHDVVRITELSTRLVMEEGRPYVIMGSSEMVQSMGGALFTYRTTTSVRRLLQVLSIEIGK